MAQRGGARFAPKTLPRVALHLGMKPLEVRSRSDSVAGAANSSEFVDRGRPKRAVGEWAASDDTRRPPLPRMQVIRLPAPGLDADIKLSKPPWLCTLAKSTL